MSARLPYIPQGVTNQGRLTERDLDARIAEKAQPLPAEACTEIGCDDDGPWESADREVLRWLSVAALKLAAVLGLSLWSIQAGLAVGAMWGAP